MADAERCQRLRRGGAPIGPLHGVPLIVKDNIACAGLPLTLGCRALAGVRAERDALVIQRLRAAGAIILARANMSEFAFDVRSRSSLGGDVRNPLAPQLTAGGSSGGCAAAVAAGNGRRRYRHRYRRLHPHSLQLHRTGGPAARLSPPPAGGRRAAVAE
ncbi:amidase family protein [Pluralibacter gergoviae]|uniref:amidase family protein n=1 Tax=Pluralibacter gergoviae TaxID=61647 RepID=UPI003075B173